jgi:peptide/nickel transport system substrate-binding protein
MTEHDPDRANAYLDEMGLTERDAEGYRLRPDGERLSFAFEYVFSTAYRTSTELMVAHYKDLGVELLAKEDERTLYEERIAAATFDMATWATGTTYNPIIRRDWFACKFGRPYTNYRAWWTSGGEEGTEPPDELRIKELYELDDEFEATSDMEEWKRIIRAMFEIQMDQLLYTGVITSPPEQVITKNYFRNVPEEAIQDWQCMTPGNAVPEQFYIEQ